jgi:hypothetical protein
VAWERFSPVIRIGKNNSMYPEQSKMGSIQTKLSATSALQTDISSSQHESVRLGSLLKRTCSSSYMLLHSLGQFLFNMQTDIVLQARPLLSRALETGNLEELVDSRLEKNFNEVEMFRMIESAAACIRHSSSKRPRMSQVYI